MDKNEMISLLNEDLKREYAAAIQYFQHASVLNGLYVAFAEELRTHAGEELSHARKISDYINYLGGWPVAMPSMTYTATGNMEMLSQDLAGENTAIERYSERITQARSLEMYGLESILLDIIEEEESHANDLKTILIQ